jgi:hypothetical protein
MYSETGHDEKWRNDVAKDLNALIEHSKTQNKKLKQAIVRTVERVADFEEIEES